MGYREMERDGRPGVEFSWEGNDEAAMAEPGEDIPAEGVWAELGIADDRIGHRSESLRPLASGALLTSDGRAGRPRSCGRRRRRWRCS
jgi:hypothetical protein